MKRKNHLRKDATPDLDVSSMIDVSFLLLIFFIVTSTLVKRENDLGLQLPYDVSGNDPQVPLAVNIAGDGRISIGGHELAGPSDGSMPSQLEGVRRELVEHRERSFYLGEAPHVNVRASGDASSQRFIDVINALAFADSKHVSILDSEIAN